MRCAQCGFETPSGSAFCARCGSRLQAARPASQREFTLVRIWPSWWMLARQFFVAALLAGLGVYLVLMRKEQWHLVPVVWLLAVVFVGIAWITRRATSWSLTSERLIERRGILVTRQRQLELADIRSVEIDRRFIQKLLGIGDVTVASAASADFAIRMTSVSDPARIAEMIRQARLKRLA
jgi:uncharacterized membrane protein YdbT with pleckstrin-like domain